MNSIEHGLVDVVMDSTWLAQQRTAAESAALRKSGIELKDMVGKDVFILFGVYSPDKCHFRRPGMTFKRAMPNKIPLDAPRVFETAVRHLNFVRGPRGLQFTEAGDTLAAHTFRMFSDLDAMA